MLLLPRTIALSLQAAAAIRDFVAAGGTVVADGRPGLFDQHGRAAAAPLLGELYPAGPAAAATGFSFGKGRAIYLRLSQDVRRDAESRARDPCCSGREAGLSARRDGRVRRSSDVETRVFENGAARIVALQRDFDAADPAEREAIVLTLPKPLHVRDIRSGHDLGETDRVTLRLGRVEPVLLALFPAAPDPPSIAAPPAAHTGETVEVALRSGTGAAQSVFHVEAVDPDGRIAAAYSGNLLAPNGRATAALPFAVNDKTGIWHIRVREAASGLTATAELRVEP